MGMNSHDKAAPSEPESTIGGLGLPRPTKPAEMNPVVRNADNRGSRTLAIHAFCAHCMGCTSDWQEPGWRNEVRNCTSTTCPLWHFRPFKEAANA